LVILATNLGMFLWSRQESRTDYRHLDTVINEIRGEISAINKGMSDFQTKLALQDAGFKAEMLRLEEKYLKDRKSA